VTALFADTSFWIALSSRRDEYYARALAWSRDLTRTQASILTTEAVLWDWMNALSDSATRRIAAAGYYRCHRDAHIEVIPFSADLVDAAMQLYGTQHDKNWSLTDCFSFVVMEQRRVAQALTTDHPFCQAGFEAVLLSEPQALV
jgi:predicted nucleic acid-binding protein